MRSVFCSELTVYLMQLGGFLIRLDAATTSPMALFAAAQQDVADGVAQLSWNREYGTLLAGGRVKMNF